MKKNLLMIVAICASAASADVVVFENTSSELESLSIPTHGSSMLQTIDITIDSHSQPDIGPPTARSFGWYLYIVGASATQYRVMESKGGQVRLAADALVPVHGHPAFMVATPRDFEVGEEIGPGEIWDESTLPASYPGRHLYSWLNGPNETWNVDEECTIGVEVTIDGQVHYGFMTMAIDQTFFVWDATWTPIRWGYETEPNTPIAVRSGCPADLAAPYGTLDFFDVSGFLDAFNNQQAAADLAAPFGAFDFFDVSAFLSAFNAGCP